MDIAIILNIKDLGVRRSYRKGEWGGRQGGELHENSQRSRFYAEGPSRLLVRNCESIKLIAPYIDARSISIGSRKCLLASRRG